jgi:hypothetical protein
MASTFTAKKTAASASNAAQPLNVLTEDAVSAFPGLEMQAMSNQKTFMAQGPDGSTYWAEYDELRSIPGVKRVVRRVL